MIKYEILAWSYRIVPVEVVSETAKMYTIKTTWNGQERTHKKMKEGYFDTWEYAHKYMIAQASKRIEEALMKVEYCRDQLDKINAMKDDTK